MANKLFELAEKAARENKKKKKIATVSGAKATATAASKPKNHITPKFDPGKKTEPSNYGSAALLGVKDAAVGYAGEINLRQSNKNAGSTHSPGSGRRHNYTPSSKDTLKKVHTEHQETANKSVKELGAIQDKDLQKLEEYKKGVGPLGKMGMDIAYTGGQMATDIAAGTILTGGLGAAGGAVNGIGRAGKIVSNVIGRGGVTKALASGRADVMEYNKAISEGATDQEARAAGLSVAALEYLTESLFGVGTALKSTMGKGIVDVEKLLKLGTRDVIKSTGGRAVAQSMAQFGLTAGTEGAEEFISGMVQPLLEKVIYSKEPLNLGEMIQSSFYQAAIGAALGSGFGAVDVVNSANQGRFLSDPDTITAMVDEGLNSKENTKAYKLARQMVARNKNGIQPTSFELNQLHNENIKAIQEEQREDEKVKSVTDKAIEKNVGKEFIVDVKDIDGVSGYYNEAQQNGVDLEVPVTVHEYAKIKESVSKAMTEKLKAAKMEGTGEAETQSISRILIGQADARDFTRLYPANQIAREVFEQETGQTLPGTNAETREYLLNYNENMRVAAANMEKNPSSLYVRDNAIRAFRRAGEMKLPIESVKEYGTVLSEAEQQRAYESGQNKTVEKEVKAKTQEPKKNRSTVRTESDYGLFDETSTKEKSDKDDAVDKFAKKMKLKVIKKDSIKSADGKAANGYYENGVIVIAKNSTLPFDKVFSHELWHHLKQVSPKNADALESFVKKEFFGNDAIKYDNELKRLGKLYGNQDDTFLFEEFMSDQVHELLSDETLTQKLATENKGLAQAIIDFINQFIDSIKAIFGDTNSGDFFAQLGIKEEAVQMLADTIKGIDTKVEVKAENAEPKYQISDKLSADLDKVLNNTMGENEEVYVGTTSNFLVDGIGVKSLNVTMPVLKAYAAMVSKDQAIAENRYHSNTEYHNLGSDLLVKALKSSEDPIMAYYQITTTKKGVKVGRIVLITPEKDNAGKTIVVVEEINTRGLVNGKGEDVNKVITVHDRTSISALVKDAVVNNLVLYSDKKRISTIAAVPEVQFLHNMNDAFYGYNIQHFWEEVNYEKTKPKEKPYEPATSTALGDKLNAAMKNKEGKFSLSEPVEMKNGLIAVHNLSETSLKGSLNLGGFPMPSIAIVTPELGHENFGDISVIFGRDTVDPSYDANRVYSGDAWTPTFPQVDVELNQKSLDKLRDKLLSVKTQRFNDGHVDYDGDNFKTHYNNAGSMEKYADNNYDLKLAYLKEIGEPYGKFPVRYEKHGYESGGQISDEDVIKLSEKMPEELIGEFSKMKFFDASKFAKEHADEILKIATDTIGQTETDAFSVLLAIKKYRNGYEPTTTEYPDVTRARIEVDYRIDTESYHAWVNDILKNVFVKKGIRNNRETFTNSGSRRSFDALHYEFTLENLVRAMKEEPENGNQPWGVSAGFLKGKLAKRFKSVQEIKNNIDKLNDDDTVKLAYDELNNSIMDIVTRMTDRYINTHPDENSFMVTDNAASALVEAAESAKTPTAIKRVFDQYSYQISYTNELIDDVIALFNATIDLPVRLFESKPRRAVELDEIKLVVLPKETSQSLVDELQSKNIPVDFYDPSIEGDRVEKVNGHSEIRWSLQDSDGKKLTKEQAEFFKGSKIRDNDGNLLLLYRSNEGNRTVWSGRGEGTWVEGIFLTDDYDVAKAFARNRDSGVMQVYANAMKPFMIDAKGNNYMMIPVPKDAPKSLREKSWYDMMTDADNLPIWAFQHGYDAVIIKNVTEGIGGEPATDIILKDSNQMKLTDNLNPTADDDIRYSLSDTDTPQGMDYTVSEIKDMVRGYFDNVMDGEDVSLVDIAVYGSRTKGLAKETSDMDVIVEYSGDVREDVLFNILNEEPMTIDGITIDINPITKWKSGTMAEYLKRLSSYDQESEIRYQLQAAEDTDRIRIRQKIEELQTLLSQEEATNKGLLPDIKTRDALVRKLRTDYNSEIKPSELVAGLNEIYKLLKSGKKNLETAFETSHELAKDIVSQGGVLNTETEKDYKALKEYMRTKPLKIEDEHKGDFGKGEWNRFRKSMFGKLNLTDSGQTIDSFYKDEILPLFPGHLDPELTHPTDILNHVLEVIDELAPSFDTFDINSYTGREMVDMVQLDILDAMFGMDPQKPLSANQRRNKYQNILESIDKATGEYANKTAQQLQEEKIKYQSMLSELEVSEANRRIEQKKRYDELMAELVKERDEQLKLLKLKGDEKLKKQEELFRKRLEKTKARFYEQRTKGEMMDSIKRNADYLAEALIHPTDTKHIPEGYQRAVAEVLNGLDFESTHTDAWEKRMGTPGKRVMRLRKLARQYEDILDGKEESFAEFDEEMRPLIRTLSDTLDSEDGGKRLSELDNEELNTVRVILKHLRHVISTSNRAFNDRIKETYSELGESIIKEMSTSKMKKEYSGLWGSVGQFFGEQIVAPTDFFALAGGTINRLYYEVRKGFDKHINNVTDAMSYIDSAMEGLNRKDVKKWSEGYGKATTFTLSDGSQIQLLQSQIMSLYALNKREQARGHIYGSGIVVAPLSVKEKGLKEKLAKTHRMVTESDVNMILASLTDEQKSLANKLLRFISTTTSEWGNETSMKLYGIKKYTETDYFPIKSDKAFLLEQFEVKGDPKLKNMGFTKSTVDLANNPIVIDDFFNVITNHITQMSMYNALVPALTDFERVYNYTHKEGGRQTNSVKNMIQGTMGQKGIAYISRFMQNVNGSYNREYGIEWAEKLLSGFKKSALGLNMRVLVQQPTSLIRASMVIDHAYLLEGMAQKTIGNATRKEMWNHVPIARWKSWGYAQTDVSREQKDIMLGNTNMLDTITMGAYGFADDISWTVLYAAVKAETKDKHPELEFDTPEYWEHIVDRFNEVVDKTQVVDSVFHRTEIMREKTFFKKTLTSFMPEPLKLYNMVRTQLFLANKEMKEGNSGEAAKMYARIGTSLIPYFAVLTAVQSIMDTIRRSWTGEDDDDEKSYWELFQINFWDNLIDNVNPMNMLPFFRDVWSSISGYDVKRPDLAIVTNMADDVKRLVTYFDPEKESPYTLTYISRKLGEDLVSFFGIPLKNLTREIESATWGIMSAMGYTQAAIYFRNKMKFKVLEKKSDNIDLYLKAEMFGSFEDAKLIYDDLKKEGITEKDITDRVKYTYGKEFREALGNGLFTTAKGSIDKMISAGVTREELVNSVRNSVGEYYKEAFATENMDDLAKYDEVLAKVGFTETDLSNYRYGYAKGYAKYQVYTVLQESGETAAYQEAEKWVNEYPGIYESADSLMYGIERSADSTKSDWEEGKWRKDSFDKFE